MQYYKIKLAKEKRARVCTHLLFKELHFSFLEYFYAGHLGMLY